MAQLCGDPDFPEEPLPAQGLRQMGMEDFYGDVAVVLEVAREVDHRHAAVAHLALNGVVLLEGGRELTLQVWHSLSW